MKNLLYIRLFNEQGFYFGCPLHLSEKYENTYDLDNFSGQEVVSMAIKFFDQTEVDVIIESQPEAKINKLMNIFNAIRQKKEANVEFIGEHPMKNYLTSF